MTVLISYVLSRRCWWWKVQESLTNTREDGSCLHGIRIKIAKPPLPSPQPYSAFPPPPTWMMISSSWAHPPLLCCHIGLLYMCRCAPQREHLLCLRAFLWPVCCWFWSLSCLPCCTSCTSRAALLCEVSVIQRWWAVAPLKVHATIFPNG